jgi:sodium-dependent dicarboxylate transporter 2/3/5
VSLAAAISASGADAPLAAMLGGMAGLPMLVLMLLLAVVIVFSGELTSNTAAATVTVNKPVVLFTQLSSLQHPPFPG